MMDDKTLREIKEKVADGKRNGNGYMAWVENSVLDDLLAENARLQAELDAAIEDLNGAQACFSCKHFRRNGGKCSGGGSCRTMGVKIIPCDEPDTYRAEIPDDGRDTYEWRGVKGE